MRGATGVTLQHHHIVPLPRKMTLMIHPRRIWNKIYIAQSNIYYLPMSQKKSCAFHEKWLSWSILVTYETFFTMSKATGVTLQHHHIIYIMPLPRKMTLMIHPRRIWNIIYIAQSNICYLPKNGSHDRSSSHMKRSLQWVKLQGLPSNITILCRCHEKWLSWFILVAYET